VTKGAAGIDSVYGDDELASLYDLEYGEYGADLLLYEQFAARGDGTALELCAGTGRVALHLARSGHRVTAIDQTPAMLSRLRSRADDEKLADLRIEQGDMRSFDLGARFGLVFIALNSFEHNLTAADASATLASVARHLAPDGAFVLQLHTLASVDWAQHEFGTQQLAWDRVDPETGDVVSKLTATRADATTQVVTHRMIFDRYQASGGPLRRRAYDLWLRIYGLPEFEALLSGAGLRLTQAYGDADLSPLTSASDRMVLVATHARAQHAT
jgi:SAM-dependent methyltransferase